MIRILVVYERMMATVAGMKTEFASMFDNDKDVSITFEEAGAVTQAEIDEADIVSLVRPENSLAYRIGCCAKKAGKSVIVFCDDDLLGIPVGINGTPARKRTLRKSLKIADAFETPSRFLADKYSSETKTGKYHVCKTAVDPGLLKEVPEKELKPDTIKLVYAAGNDHVALFNNYILPILPQLGKKYGDRISLTFVGVHPDTDECNKYVKTYYQPGMPLEEYRQYMRENAFDIGLAPLKDTPFSRCKHYNKFVEYTLVGIPGIYSNMPPYTYVVNDNEDGFLSDNIPEKWYDKICAAIDDEALRKHCIEKAMEYLRVNHDPNSVREDYKEFFFSICNNGTKKTDNYFAGLYKLEYSLQRLADMTFLSIATLKSGGINGLIERTKAHITGLHH